MSIANNGGRNEERNWRQIFRFGKRRMVSEGAGCFFTGRRKSPAAKREKEQRRRKEPYRRFSRSLFPPRSRGKLLCNLVDDVPRPVSLLASTRGLYPDRAMSKSWNDAALALFPRTFVSPRFSWDQPSSLKLERRTL